MNKFIIVGKCYKNQNTGPANIIRGLKAGLEKKKINVEAILLSETCPKKLFLKKLFKMFICERRAIINVHTDGFLICMIIYLFSLVDLKNKYYLTVHGCCAIECSIKCINKRFYCYLERVLYKHFPNIICVSEMLKGDIKKLYGREKNVYVIPNATEITEKNHTKAVFGGEPLRMVMLGGVKQVKGIWETLDLISYLSHNKKISLFLDIYGSEEDEQIHVKFKNKVADLELEEIVRYHGNITDKTEIYRILCNTDFQLCLSRYDTFNVAVIESLVIGCPCICSERCGAKYLIENEENGLIVDINSKGFMEESYMYLKSFIDNPEKYLEIEKYSEKLRSQVSWDGVCEAYLKKTGFSKRIDYGSI